MTISIHCHGNLLTAESKYSMIKKNLHARGFLKFFSQWLKIYDENFTRLLHVHTLNHQSKVYS